jgi:hypothetical protein
MIQSMQYWHLAKRSAVENGNKVDNAYHFVSSYKLNMPLDKDFKKHIIFQINGKDIFLLLFFRG